MRKISILNSFVGTMSGLMGLVNASCNSVTQEVLDNSSFPADTGERRMSVYEEDLKQNPENFVFPLKPIDPEDRLIYAVATTPQSKDRRTAPFKSFTRTENANGETAIHYGLKDNEIDDYFDGNEWNFKIEGKTTKGRYVRIVKVEYNRGNSPSVIGDELEGLDDRLGNVEEELFGYRVDDGVCESEEGETHGNSPNDCPADDGNGDGGSNGSELFDRVRSFACGLERAVDDPSTLDKDEGADLRLYKVSTVEGNLFSEPLLEVNGGRVHHIIKTSEISGNYVVVKAGISLGEVIDMYEVDGALTHTYNQNCRDTLILNINSTTGVSTSLPEGEHIVYANGDKRTAELVRVEP